MEFGKLEDISNIDWTLPSDDLKNALRLNKDFESKLYIGAPMWGAKSWIGKIYPLKTSPDKFLYYYSRNFNCIELNTSHYRIPSTEKTIEWLSLVPSDFQFCPKMYKEISHAKNALLDKELIQEWIRFLERMRPNLGPCFIQLHEQFSYAEKALLFRFLENWPSEFRISLELRHPSWFQNGIILPALTDYLYQRKIGLVITDVAGRRDVLHSSLSTNWTMIRLIGNELDVSDELRLQSWAKRIKLWNKMGLKETYLFLHQPVDTPTIEFASMAEDIFKKNGFEDVPHIINEEETQAGFNFI